MPSLNGIQETAVLLRDGTETVQTANVSKVLRFFGVPWREQTLVEFSKVGLDHGPSDIRLICSTDGLLRLIDSWGKDPQAYRSLSHKLHSIFVFSQESSETLQRLSWRLTDGSQASVVEISNSSAAVSDSMEDFCGIMGGFRIGLSRQAPIRVLSGLPFEAKSVISIERFSVFAKFVYGQVPIFVSTSSAIVDLEERLETGIFDLRDHLLAALPLTLFVKWAFPNTAWTAPEVNACLVIDDPVLKRSHGFVDFAELLRLMKQHGFSTNIAFIPWNWRRSDPRIATLFSENRDSYSISVHGCDHTNAEFGSTDIQRTASKVDLALKRMDRHARLTGIQHDRVMVFPQGVFSTAAMTVMKSSELIAAVNNDTISADARPVPITIADFWDTALMKYNSFALFTRRYPWEGLENFAFDALLGKPAIIIIHHDSCRDHCKALLDFIDRFNSLRPAPVWRGLGQVVRRSCRQRQRSENAVEVQMYGSELRLDNQSDQRKQFCVQRNETLPSSIRNIQLGSRSLGWRASDSSVSFELELDPGESAVIRIQYNRAMEKPKSTRTDVAYEMRTMARRYLCELRDNYLTKYKLVLKSSLSKNEDVWT